MAPFELATDGDNTEQIAWATFLRHEFPHYEAFWQVFVVELTGRTWDGDQTNIRLREQADLDKIDRPPWHVAVAQLHYTTLLHLVRAFEIRHRRVRDRDSFTEAIVRLSAATDTAFELLGRCLLDPDEADTWNQNAGKRIRERWAQENDRPLQSIRSYRNDLLHGRVQMVFDGRLGIDGERYTNVLFFPRFERLSPKPDWREANPDDAAPADQLVDEAWDRVLAYFRETWDGRLLPWARESFEAPERPPAKFTFNIRAVRSLSADSPVPPVPYTPPGSAIWPVQVEPPSAEE